MQQTDRYRTLKQQGKSGEQIRENFNTPVEMQVFSYDGMIDTVLSPMDSIRWNKHFLRCGFMSIEPHSGHVKAYVGGPNFSYFQYDMATMGRRQVGLVGNWAKTTFFPKASLRVSRVCSQLAFSVSS